MEARAERWEGPEPENLQSSVRSVCVCVSVCVSDISLNCAAVMNGSTVLPQSIVGNHSVKSLCVCVVIAGVMGTFPADADPTPFHREGSVLGLGGFQF